MYYNIFYLKNSSWKKYIKTKYIWYNYPIVLSSLENKNTKSVCEREREREREKPLINVNHIAAAIIFHSRVFEDSASWLLYLKY